MSLQIFLYQKLAGLQRREKIGQAVKNSRAGREMGIACKHHFKYLSPPSFLPTSRKPFLPSKCQNVWHIRASHACRIWLYMSEARWLTFLKCWHKLSKLANHRVYQELVYRNEVLQTMLTGSSSPSLPRPPRGGFRATFSFHFLFYRGA